MSDVDALAAQMYAETAAPGMPPWDDLTPAERLPYQQNAHLISLPDAAFVRRTTERTTAHV